jgi:hypothetical protein
MTVEFIAVPLVFIILVMSYLLYIVHQKRIGLIKLNRELDQALVKSNEHTIKQHSIIELMKGNRCGKHVFDIGDRVVLIQHINALSHRVVEILIKKNMETMYKIRLQDRAMWAPEHTLNLYAEPGKD